MIASSHNSNKVITIKDEKINGENYHNAVISANKYNKNQVFNVKITGDGHTYCIKQKSTGYNFDVQKGGAVNNLGVWSGTSNGAPSGRIQKWTIIKEGSYYKIVSQYDGKYVDLHAGDTTDGHNVHLYPFTLDNPNQRWTLIKYKVPTVSGGSLAAGTVGTKYTASLTVSGCGTMKCTVSSEKLPGGLSLSSDGKISGTPTVAGTFNFTVKVTDTYGSSGIADCSITINNVAVTGITLNKTDISLEEGESFTLVATVKPSGATNKGVSWSISNSDIAIVDASGKVTAKSGGTTTIIAKTDDGGKTAVCTVTVISTKSKEPPTFIYGDTHNLDGVIGVYLSYEIGVLGASPIKFSVIEGSLPDGLVLSSDGIISGTPEKEGSFRSVIRAENEWGYEEGEFIYTIYGSGVPSLSGNTLDFRTKVGEQFVYKLKAVCDYPFSWRISGGASDWLSIGNSCVLYGTPDEEGEYYLTATAYNDYGEASINVTITVVGDDVPSYDTITINPSFVTIEVGEEYALAVETTSGEAVKWSSSDKNIAKVKKNVVIGVSAGRAVVTAKAVNISAEATITVVEPSKDDEMSIAIGEKKTLKLKKKPAVVIVSDDSVISLKKKGKKIVVSGLSEGTTTIIAYNKKGRIMRSWEINVK